MENEITKAAIAPQMALVAVTANNGLINDPKKLARKALELSDALIAELNNEIEVETEPEAEKKNNA